MRLTSIGAWAIAFLVGARADAERNTMSDSALDARTTAVAVQLRCPVCQGESIQESPAELAKQMRDIVREQLSAGKSPEEVKAYFVSKYGQWILLQPRVGGFNLIVYGLPVLAVLGGLAVIVTAVRRWTHAPEDATALPTPPVD
jgi:cytochrome c-type biogenesis protein CcmH